MKKCLLLIVFVVFGHKAYLQDHYPRNKAIDILHYIFELELNDDNNLIKGKTTVKLLLNEVVPSFQLDFVKKKADGKGMLVKKISQGQASMKFTQAPEKLDISLPASSKKGDEIILTIEYEGIPSDGLIISKNKFGNRTFFGDNWPNRAHHWLPVIDHPYEKATCEFIVTAPEHYEVIANGSFIEKKKAGAKNKITHWKSSETLPTKVMVIGVADFSIQYADTLDGVPVESWVYPQNEKEGFYDYALAVKVLDFFEKNIADYPFSKLANVQSTTRYGGMENAGNIFYDENSVTGSRTSEALISHEIVHQWFGNTASEADWHHLWLSEGFATYLTHWYFEKNYGRNQLVERMEEDKNNILLYHQSHPKSPIIDLSIKDLNALLNTNNYQKAGWVLHMLRYQVGDENFWKGVKTYYEKFKFKNAYTADFQKVMEEVSGQSLEIFFKQWLYTPSIPNLEVNWKFDSSSKILSLKVVQKQADVFNLAIELAIYNPTSNQPETHKIILNQKIQEFKIPIAEIPHKITIDPNKWLLVNTTITKDK